MTVAANVVGVWGATEGLPSREAAAELLGS